jgi:hypothetical protein
VRADLYSDIATAVKVKIESEVDLVGIGIKSVVRQVAPDISALTDSGTQLPVASITTEGETETLGPDSSESESGWYPIRVHVLDSWERSIADPHSLANSYLNMRGALMQPFRTPKTGKFELPGAPEVIRCQIVPEVTFDPTVPKDQSIKSSFLLRFWARAVRE